MAIVLLQTGQCGTQLGQTLYDTVHPEEEYQHIFFRHSTKHECIARAVLVDMEPKVLHGVLQGQRAWHYDPIQTIIQQSGSGNNWACGYHRYGPQVSSTVMNALRREMEACDVVQGVLHVHSGAGGTGSGLGTYLTEVLVEEFPAVMCLNGLVWPFPSGEIIVQHYNTLLTVAGLTQSSDGIILMENQGAAAICRQLWHVARPSLQDLNHVMAQQLAMTLLSTNQTRFMLGDMVQHACVHPVPRSWGAVMATRRTSCCRSR